MITIETLLPQRIKDKIKEKGLWTFNIDPPNSLDDAFIIKVRIVFGRNPRNLSSEVIQLHVTSCESTIGD